MKVIVGDSVDMDVKFVPVKDQFVKKTIESAGYDYINLNILENQNLIHKPGSLYMGVWRPNQCISSEKLEQKIISMILIVDGKIYRGRPSTIEEIASYEVLFHEDLKESIVIALKEVITIKESEYVVFRDVIDSKRRLGLHVNGDIWAACCRFLVIFEDVVE